MTTLGVRPLHEAYWIPKWKFRDEELGEDKEAEIFIFGNGSFVCWGMTEEHAVMFQKEVLKRTGAELVPFREAETEELEFVTDPSECVYLPSFYEMCLVLQLTLRVLFFVGPRDSKATSSF